MKIKEMILEEMNPFSTFSPSKQAQRFFEKG